MTNWDSLSDPTNVSETQYNSINFRIYDVLIADVYIIDETMFAFSSFCNIQQ